MQALGGHDKSFFSVQSLFVAIMQALGQRTKQKSVAWRQCGVKRTEFIVSSACLFRFPTNTSSDDSERRRCFRTSKDERAVPTPPVSCIHFVSQRFYGFKRSTLSMLLFSSNRIWVSLSSVLRVDFLWMFILEATIMEEKRNKSDINAEAVCLHNKRFNHFFLFFLLPEFLFPLIWWMHQRTGDLCLSAIQRNFLIDFYFSKASLSLSFIKVFDFILANKQTARLANCNSAERRCEQKLCAIKKNQFYDEVSRRNWNIQSSLAQSSIHPFHDFPFIRVMICQSWKEIALSRSRFFAVHLRCFCGKIAGWIVADNYWDNSHSQKRRQKAERCRKMPH